MEYQNLAHYEVGDRFRGRSKYVVQLWWIVQDTLFRWSPQVMFGWRRFLLRLFGAKIGKHVKIRPTVRITYPWKVSIGDYSWIGDHVDLYSLGEIHIGSHTSVSMRVYLCTGTHDYTKPTFDICQIPIRVGDQVWIANDVFVAPGVTIANGAVVGARSSVFDDLDAGKVYMGSPARYVKDRIVAP